MKNNDISFPKEKAGPSDRPSLSTIRIPVLQYLLHNLFVIQRQSNIPHLPTSLPFILELPYMLMIYSDQLCPQFWQVQTVR